MRCEPGFTIVEIVITLVILGILVTAAVSRFFDLSQAADRSACRSNQLTLETAQQFYYIRTMQQNNGAYATTIDQLAPYLKDGQIPQCPADGTYQILMLGRITCSFADHQR